MAQRHGWSGCLGEALQGLLLHCRARSRRQGKLCVKPWASSWQLMASDFAGIRLARGLANAGGRDASMSIDAKLILLCSAATVCLRCELASEISSAQCGLRLASTPFGRAAREAAVPLLAFNLAPPHTAQLHAAAAISNVARRTPITTRRALRHARRTHAMRRRRHPAEADDLEGVVRQARATPSA